MKVIDAAKRFDSLIPLHWCTSVINFINQTNKKKLTTSGGLREEVRNVEGTHFHPPLKPYSLNDFSKEDLIKELPKCIFSLQLKKLLEIPLLNYTTIFPECGVSKLLQIDFLKYEPGGKYEQHIDRGPLSNRYLTVIINLNSDYEGGEFVFFNPSTRNKEMVKEEKLKDGSVLIFPSNFLFPHSIKPIIKGTRYSLVCWLE